MIAVELRGFASAASQIEGDSALSAIARRNELRFGAAPVRVARVVGCLESWAAMVAMVRPGVKGIWLALRAGKGRCGSKLQVPLPKKRQLLHSSHQNMA